MFAKITPISDPSTEGGWYELVHRGTVLLNLDHVESIVRHSGDFHTVIYMSGSDEPAYLVLETPEEIIGGK